MKIYISSPSIRLPGPVVLAFVILLATVFSSFSPWASAAETWVPVTVVRGTSLIHLARDYCYDRDAWKEIARVNHLVPPYTIYAEREIKIPLSLLLTRKVTATVVSVHGEVARVHNDSVTEAVQKGDKILAGQTIVTGEGSYAQLLFPDNKFTRIDPNSELRLNYLFRLTDGKMKAEFFLKQGNIVHSVKKKLRSNESFNTKTRVSITGIRGTEFRMKTDEDATNIIETLQGVVRVNGTAGGTVTVNKGQGVQVRAGEPPAAPRLLPQQIPLPPLEPVYRTLPVVLSPVAPATVDRLRLRVTTDEQGQETVADYTVRHGGEFVLPSLDDGSYYLFLTAVDSENFESLPTGPQPLVIRTQPAAPILLSPKNGAQIWESTIQAKWLKSEQAREYLVQIAKDDQFTRLVDEIHTTDITYTSSALPPGTYFLRVQAIAADNFVSLFSFPVSWTVVEQPKLDGIDTTAEEGISFRWPATMKDCTYEVNIASDKRFDTLVLQQGGLTTTSYTLTSPLEPGTYYVRVRALLPDGRPSRWAPYQTMVIEAEPLGLEHLFLSVALVGLLLL